MGSEDGDSEATTREATPQASTRAEKDQVEGATEKALIVETPRNGEATAKDGVYASPFVKQPVAPPIRQLIYRSGSPNPIPVSGSPAASGCRVRIPGPGSPGPGPELMDPFIRPIWVHMHQHGALWAIQININST